MVVSSPTAQLSLSTQPSMDARNPCTPLSPRSPFGSERSGSTLPCGSDDEISLTSASGMDKAFAIPSSWPPVIMQCIKLESDEERKRALTPSIRNEIVRVLASHMFCHNPNPRKEFCETVAKMLVKKYKFMKDTGEKVTGHVSIYRTLLALYN